MTNSREKGHAFERTICKVIGEWISEHVGDEITLRRNLAQYQTSALGDIEHAPFIFECKRYAKGNWHRQEWWDQVCRAADQRLIPVLVYRFDRQETKFVFPLWAISNHSKVDHITVTASEEDARHIILGILDDPKQASKRFAASVSQEELERDAAYYRL